MAVNLILNQLHRILDSGLLAEEILLVPQPSQPWAHPPKQAESIDVVVGYDGSPHSCTALSLAFYMAHRLQTALQKQVTMHAVYVVQSPTSACWYAPSLGEAAKDTRPPRKVQRKTKRARRLAKTGKKVRESLPPSTRPSCASPDHVDQVLWQARCLAEEWRGAFNAHLRFGDIAAEIGAIAQAENAAFVVLGCSSFQHPLVQQLANQLACPVLGIPSRLLSASSTLQNELLPC